MGSLKCFGLLLFVFGVCPNRLRHFSCWQHGSGVVSALVERDL
jgi:hypothetical protein